MSSLKMPSSYFISNIFFSHFIYLIYIYAPVAAVITNILSTNLNLRKLFSYIGENKDPQGDLEPASVCTDAMVFILERNSERFAHM